MVFLPDGKLAVAGGRPGEEGDVRIYDLNGGTPKVENGVAYPRRRQRQGRHGQAAARRRRRGAVPGRQRRRQEAGLRRLRPHRQRLGPVRRRLANAKLEQSIENHADWVFGVAFSPDGKHLLTCSRDKTAKVWDLTTKESVLTFPDHQNAGLRRGDQGRRQGRLLGRRGQPAAGLERDRRPGRQAGPRRRRPRQGDPEAGRRCPSSRCW